MRCTPPQTLGTHTLTVRFTSMYTYPILSANGLPARSPIQLDPSCNRLSNTRLDTRCDSDHASHMNVLKKIPGFSLSDYVHSPRAQALPSNFNSSQLKGLIIPQNTLSLLGTPAATSWTIHQTQRKITIMATNSLLPNYWIFSFPSVRLYLPSLNIVGFLRRQMFLLQKKTEFPQLLSYFTDLYTLSFPNNCSIVLQTEYLLHQTPKILACLRLPNNASLLSSSIFLPNRLGFLLTLPNRHPS
jgi:hypothetical protein